MPEKKTLHFGAVLSVLCGLITAPLSTAQQDPCSQINAVRLAPSESLNLVEDHTGRVEICYLGLWSPICHGSGGNPGFWPEKNALVVCKQLGFSGSLNPINSRVVPLDDRSPRANQNFPFEFNCDGTENSLANCAQGDPTIINCLPEFEAYITCRPNIIQMSPVHQGYPREGDVRLVGDTTNGDGAVEYYRSNIRAWLPICPDSNWDNDDATVVCRQLGFGDGVVENIEVLALEGSQQIMTNFQCDLSDNPNGLGACSSQLSTTSLCTRDFQTFAGINCRTAVSVLYRFIGPNGLPVSSTEGGIIEIPNGFGPSLRWGPWCGRGWTQEDADALCTNFFGAESGVIPQVNPTVESGLRPIWSTNVDCGINSFGSFSCTGTGNNNPGAYAECSPSDGFAVARCIRGGTKFLSNTFGFGSMILLAFLHLVIHFF